MTPNEIFARMPGTTAAAMFGELFEHEKPLYKNLVETLAKQRRLRPVYIERKPRAERFAWLKEALGRKQNESAAAHLLQIWLVSRHPRMLCDFLDSLGIKHDDNGTVDTIPPQPQKEELGRAVEELLGKHDPVFVKVYLHAFQALDDGGGWPALAEVLEADERLKLDAQ